MVPLFFAIQTAPNTNRVGRHQARPKMWPAALIGHKAGPNRPTAHGLRVTAIENVAKPL